MNRLDRATRALTPPSSLHSPDKQVPAIGLDDEIVLASIRLSAGLSSDGCAFTVKIRPAPGAQTTAPAVASFNDEGCEIVLASVPVSLLRMPPSQRLRAVLDICVVAYVRAWELLDKSIDLGDEAAERYLARMALKAPKSAVDAARRRLCH